jgi:hypothetical protein
MSGSIFLISSVPIYHRRGQLAHICIYIQYIYIVYKYVCMVHSWGGGVIADCVFIHLVFIYVVSRWSYSFASIYMCIVAPLADTQCLKDGVVRHLQQVRTFS